MINTVQQLSSQAVGNAIPMNPNAIGSIPMGLVLDFTTGTGSGTASVQFTQDSLAAIKAGTAVWFTFANLSAKTATTLDVETTPCTAVRLNVTAYSSGTIYLRILQGNNYVEQ